MTVDSAGATPLGDREKQREIRRVVLSGYLGSAIEFYDFLLYGTAAALVFPKVFFAGLDEFTAVVLSFGTFAAGYLARPLGGVIFGHFGDRIGRKKMLVITMFVMGVASFLIGLVPSTATIGGLAVVILVLLRVAQGIAVGGEWGGAALMALEHAESGKRGFTASFVNAGAPSGALLGSLMLGLFALLPEDQFLELGLADPVPAVRGAAACWGCGCAARCRRARCSSRSSPRPRPGRRKRRCRCGRCCAGRRRCS